MMGTGEAEGENRAMSATELALNPLIDNILYKVLKGCSLISLEKRH